MSAFCRVLPTTAAASLLAVTLTVALRAQAPAAGEPRIWQGIYTNEQAVRGKEVYTTTCLRCHGGDLMGVTAPPLAGERFYASWGGEPIERLFVKIRDTMPPTFGTGVVDDKTKLDIVGYILQANGYPVGNTELALGSPDLARAAIVKKGEQVAVQNFSLVETVGCLAAGDGNTWQLTRTADPSVTREDASSAQSLQNAASRPLGTRTFLLHSAVPFSPASYVGQKMEARGLVYTDASDARITLTSLKPTGQSCS